MSGAFTTVNLSQLPSPDVVETLDYEVILAEMLADLRLRDPTFTATVESDPAYKVLEVAAYRELLLRQRINDASRALMLAFARGADLDQIGANYNLTRAVIDPGNPSVVPPVPPTLESDDEFRARIQLSFEGYTSAGSVGSYVFFALNADPLVRDVSVQNPPVIPGTVEVRIMSRDGAGTASPELVMAVNSALNADEVRPLCDTVNVQTASIVNYSVVASIVTFPGVGQAEVLQSARDAVAVYTEKQRRIGLDITRSGLFAALHQPGVQNVLLSEPAADIIIDWDEASFCTSVSVTFGGEGE